MWAAIGRFVGRWLIRTGAARSIGEAVIADRLEARRRRDGEAKVAEKLRPADELSESEENEAK